MRFAVGELDGMDGGHGRIFAAEDGDGAPRFATGDPGLAGRPAAEPGELLRKNGNAQIFSA